MAEQDTYSRTAEQEIAAEREQAEALSRRDESLASIHRSRALRNAAIPGLGKIAAAATKEEGKSADAADRAAGKEPPVDPEGTAAGLADRTGSYADDAAQAQAGGIGVEDSNARKAAKKRAGAG